jgi:hypothetical protein
MESPARIMPIRPYLGVRLTGRGLRPTAGILFYPSLRPRYRRQPYYNPNRPGLNLGRLLILIVVACVILALNGGGGHP